MKFLQICKHFLEAVEKSKYGWFWSCPSGVICIYRHALPPGFVLKKDKKKDDKKSEISLEDLIEKERAALGPKQTKVTLHSFLMWKKRKIEVRSLIFVGFQNLDITGCVQFLYTGKEKCKHIPNAN